MSTPGKLAFVFVVCASSAFATTVTQSVTADRLGVEDVTQVVVEVSGADRAAQVSLPDTGDFEILGRSSSISTRIEDDGSGSPTIGRTERFTFTIHPNHTGQLQVPPAKVTVGTQVLEGAPNQLEVVEGHAAPPPTSRPDDPFASLFGSDPFAGLGGGSLFDRFFGEGERPGPLDARLLVSLDKPSVYAGEQATVSVYLAARGTLGSVGALRLPAVDGAASQELDVSKQPTSRPMTIDGREYQAWLVARRALFPSAAGTLTIPAGSLEVSGFGVPRTLRSRAVTLKVNPLPPGGAPGEPVGDWSVSTALASKRSAQVGQPLAVQVAVEGTGDLQALPEPVLEPDAPARVLPPTVKDTPRLRGGLVGGKRVFEFLVTPDAPGRLTLSAVKLPYFDPATGRHEVATSAPLTLDVAPAVSAAPVAGATTPTAAPSAPSPRAGPSPSSALWVLVGTGLAVGLALAGWALRRWTSSRAQQPPSPRAQRRSAAHSLARARVAAEAGRQAEAVQLAEQALTQIAQATGLAVGSVDLDRLAQDAARPAVAAWAQTMLRCRRARFMGQEPERVSELLASVAQVLQDLPRPPPSVSGGETAHAV